MPLTKSKFRENCLKKVADGKQNRKYYRDFLVNRALLRELQSSKRQNILFYYPLPNEIDIRKTLQKIRKKHNVYLPFMVGKSFKMVPFRLPLKKKRFGILEAGNTFRNIKKIDIAVVPIVGVDGNLQRIGFGKGMYDRFFAKLQKKPYTIFIQSQLCHTKEKICDVYDVMGDIVITPNGILRRKKIDVK